MTLEEIKARHEELESMHSTQSVALASELSSQAHKDRGYLLDLIDMLMREMEESDNL